MDTKSYNNNENGIVFVLMSISVSILYCVGFLSKNDKMRFFSNDRQFKTAFGKYRL